MKPKPRWMKSVITAAKEACETPLYVGHRKRGVAVAAVKPART